MDDNANAVRMITAAMAALSARSTTVTLDTFTDADRGYFVRTGLVDRRYNPRLAARLLQELMAMAGAGPWRRESERETAIVNAAGRVVRLDLTGEGRPQLALSNKGGP
jgi:hypothetical protein